MQLTPQVAGLELALVQLPGHMHRALRTFRKITGLTAVTSLATSLPEPGKPSALPPPVHPSCARRLRSVSATPCRRQWLVHVRSSRRSPDAFNHTCPIGLRCSCVPIRFDNRLVGVAKLVVDPGTSEAALQAATAVLELVVSKTSYHSLASALSDEVRVLRQCVSGLQQVRSTGEPPANGSGHPAAEPDADRSKVENGTVVGRAIAYLHEHYQEPNLSLRAIAKTLGCNPMYLTSRFTQIVGEPMHRYLVGLRVACACRTLMGPNLSIKEVGYASGFLRPASFARTFRQRVGVSPAEYRRLFAPG